MKFVSSPRCSKVYFKIRKSVCKLSIRVAWCGKDEVGVRSHVLKRYFIRLRLFHFMGHKVEKTKSRSKIVTKSQKSLLKKSNRIEIRSFLRSDIDKLDCKRFPHVYYPILSDSVFFTLCPIKWRRRSLIINVRKPFTTKSINV